MPSGVKLKITGTLPEQDIDAEITPERAINLAESSHIEEAAKEVAAEGYRP